MLFIWDIKGLLLRFSERYSNEDRKSKVSRMKKEF